MMYALTRCRWRWFKSRFIQWFVSRFNVDMTLAAEPNLNSYEHFNEFFTRPLMAGSRPISATSGAVLCAADGVISQIGDIRHGTIVQAKGRCYTVTELLGGREDEAQAFENGHFATIYLSPRDYHRIHLPLTGQLASMVYVPGRLFSVNALTTRVIPRVFARNERLVMTFDTASGPMIVVMVGAIFVGSMETVWHGQVTPPYARKIARWSYPEGKLKFDAGDEIGRFNMGSTVIVLHPAGRVKWDAELAAGTPVQVAQTLGHALLKTP